MVIRRPDPGLDTRHGFESGRWLTRFLVTVVMPAAHGRRNPMDLPLCGHHYRVSEIALLAAGATVCDETGIVLPAGEEPVLAQAAARAT